MARGCVIWKDSWLLVPINRWASPPSQLMEGDSARQCLLHLLIRQMQLIIVEKLHKSSYISHTYHLEFDISTHNFVTIAETTLMRIYSIDGVLIKSSKFRVSGYNLHTSGILFVLMEILSKESWMEFKGCLIEFYNLDDFYGNTMNKFHPSTRIILT